MRSSLPSDQYASPRPESCLGAAPPRFPSCSPWIQSNSPVAGYNAITARRDPAVAYKTPLTMSGVAFEFVLRPVAEIVGLDAPSNFQIVEVAGVDLVQGPIATSCQISGVGRPLGVLGSKLRRASSRKQDGRSDRTEQQFPQAFRMTHR